MATSESEDFESADEDFEPDRISEKNSENWKQQVTPQTNHDDENPRSSEEPEIEIDTPNADLVDSNEQKTLDAKACITNTLGEDKCDVVTRFVDDVILDAVKSAETAEKSKPVPESEVKNADSVIGKDEFDTKKNRRHERQANKIRESKTGVPKSGIKKLGTRVPTQNTNRESEVTDTTPPSLEEDNSEKTMPSTDKDIEEINSLTAKDKPKFDTTSTNEGFSAVFDRIAKSSDANEEKVAPTQGWGWGSWGSSLLSTATASVSTLTSHVSQGLSTVIDTVEGGLGAPDPAELARQDLEAAQLIADVKEPPPEEAVTAAADEGSGEATGLFPLGQLFSGVSHLGKMVENTGAKVLSGGLDTLEVIGKKTMAVLQEGDPGLKKKRALFTPDGPILSQALREAKDRAEEEAKLAEEKQAARKVHFETLFDDYQGLIHLEALEMLCRQCEMKLQSSLLALSGPELVAVQARLQTIRDECLLPDPDDVPDEPNADVEQALTDTFSALSVSVTADKLLKVWRAVTSSAVVRSEEAEEVDDIVSMHQRAVAALAQLTACCVEQFHRTGELLLVQEQRHPQQEAAQLMQITLLESSMIEQLASSFCEALNTFGDPAQPLITKVFLEASNSSTYVQDAFQLLVPVLQIGAV